MSRDRDNDSGFDDRREDPFRDEYRGESGRKQKSSRSTLLTVLLVIAGGGVLVCCGGCFVFGYLIKPKIVNDPAAVAAAANEMLSIQIPEQFKPGTSMTTGLPPFVTAKFVVFETEDKDGMLMLMELGGSLMANAKMEDFEGRMRQQQPQARNLDVEETTTKEFEIDGRKVPFVFAKGKDPDQGGEYRTVTGMIQGKKGPVFLSLQIKEDKYDEQAVTAMLESIGR